MCACTHQMNSALAEPMARGRKLDSLFVAGLLSLLFFLGEAFFGIQATADGASGWLAGTSDFWNRASFFQH